MLKKKKFTRLILDTAAINLDASEDPTFARSLRTLGPVTPSSTSLHQPSSSPALGSNPAALQILAARSRLAAAAEREFARAGRGDGADARAGRRFVDVDTLRRVLDLRDRQQVPGEAIERKLGLERGAVGILGRKGVVGAAEGPV